ncbi:bifunctional nicotinamide-nucleotide adenylyltransferase/Nudix hydroxylase [Chitiniphilus purpureus]|uniref:Bifunctional nicotinamide-nucleotide adenylyltransferase/Nudix hydroxylase n=1 Tax=Chitiniphilus purpureus TaxID=2981137 RepID=A0ABY6DIA1_9NEIS|nr:bifunctional nicotinamide-nucleotide adenylyltransferase/Nudix hydroxylase [Chitiniphilus sp. CD1]UXY14052.1 bifunctional nicotinamide-nucleotide adenylyltransferase/Nudix hydroxylase [Chitiniphilus sp. CD1]
MATDFDVLVYIGRFQPFHASHLQMVLRALERTRRLMLVLGSTPAPRSVRNPFSFAERRAMIEAAVAEAAPQRVADLRFVPVRDYYDSVRWAAAVRRTVADNVAPGERVGLFGHVKDDTSAYLRDFPDWPFVAAGNFGGLSATPLREAWLEGRDDGWRAHVPPSTARLLDAFRTEPAFAVLQAEARYLGWHRAQWADAPYPPVFVTVDALVRCCEHVLLIRRGGQPGVGTWALPGGFLDQHERVAQAVLRELTEETRLDVPIETLVGAQAGSALFDHPQRSARGRTLTHAFYFDLPLPALPAIAAADDAAAAQWVPSAELAQMEAELFEDHFMILDHFLHLLPCR